MIGYLKYVADVKRLLGSKPEEMAFPISLVTVVLFNPRRMW